jgi:hypothetical protein
VVLAVLMLTAALAAPQAAVAGTRLSAASVTTPFHLEYGASVVDGKIIWYSGVSIRISGYVKAVSGSRQAAFTGYGLWACGFHDTRTTPAGTTRSYGFDRTCVGPDNDEFVGVDVALKDGSGNLLRWQFIQSPFR